MYVGNKQYNFMLIDQAYTHSTCGSFGKKKNTHLKISNFYSEIYYTMLDFRGQILSVWHFWLMMTKYASQVYGGYKTLTQCHTGPSS